MSPSGIVSIRVTSAAAAMGEADQLSNLVLIDALERDRVDLDAKSGILAASMPREERFRDRPNA